MPPASLTLFVTTPPGLESLAQAELTDLGLESRAQGVGGVVSEASADQLVEALLWLRTASRVSVRLGDFRARTFAELERHAGAVPWHDVLAPGNRVHFRITSKKSRLYHEDAIADRLERIASAAVAKVEAVRRRDQAEALEADVTRLPGVQRIIVRVFRDQITISADASGGALYRRGYRQATTKAPLRENLAAAMLLGSGWRADDRLVDPMAGSGTIVIEAALIARRIAPGGARRFAAELWPMLTSDPFERARADARALVLPGVPGQLVGSDRDAGAVEAAEANAARAGVADSVRFTEAVVSSLTPDAGRGWVLTNPPYGVRIGEVAALRSLYAGLGRTMERARPGWSLALLSANPRLSGQVGLPFEEAWRTTNGGIAVTLLVARAD